MILDTLTNSQCYAPLSQGIAEGLRFLQSVTPDTPTGRYQLSGNNYANIDRYSTRRENNNGMEAHRRYIDIQYLVAGQERIEVHPLDSLQCTQPYDSGRDVAFYSAPGTPAVSIVLGNGRFAIFFPDDAHMPQLVLDKPSEVLKVVVKVAVEQ